MKRIRHAWIFCLLLAAGGVIPEAAARSLTVPCTERDLLAAVRKAKKGTTILFDCRDTTIPMRKGLGDIGSSLTIDGEDRNIELEFVTDFEGCSEGNNGLRAPAIGRMRGRGSTVRSLTFRNFLESLQIDGPGNTVENSTFVAHRCSDDALSTISVRAVDSTIRNNRIAGYRDKAIQMSFGGGVIEGNEFVDSGQAIRGPYDNRGGAPFFIRDNRFVTTGERESCAGVRIDGAYVVHFERNVVECQRGVRIAGDTQMVIRDNQIRGNHRVGIRVGGRAVASMSGNHIVGNGLEGGSLPSGGVVVYEQGNADLGGGSVTIGGEEVRSEGRNVIRGNGIANVRNLRVNPGTGEGDAEEPSGEHPEGHTGGHSGRHSGGQDHHHRALASPPSGPLSALHNCWDGDDPDGIAGQIEGDVVFEPAGRLTADGSCVATADRPRTR